MKISRIFVILSVYFLLLYLCIGPIVQNIHLLKCINKGEVFYELVELRTGNCQGNCERILIIKITGNVFRLNIQEWEYEKAKKGEHLVVYYCNYWNKAYTKTSIWVNSRVSLVSILIILFWTAMLKWVFIPYDRKHR